MYQIKRVTYEDVDIPPDALMTIREAAEVLGMTMQGVDSALNRGELQEIINPQSQGKQQGRRLVLRAEVERLRS